MSIQKRMELVRVPYTRLQKLEFVSYVGNIIGIVDRHKPELLKINCTFDLLVAEVPQLNKLDVPYRAHPLTNIVTDLRKMRTVYIGSIFNHLGVVEIENKKGDVSINEVRIELHRYLKNLKSCKNEVERCQKVELFFTEIDNDKILTDAFTTLKFTEHLDKLRNVHSRIMKLRKDIIESTSKRPTEKTMVLKKSVYAAMEDLFKEVEIAQLKNKDLDYKPLCDELNRLSINYRNDLNRRVLHNKQKAEKNNKLLTSQPEESAVKTSASREVQPFKQRAILLDTEELSKYKNKNEKGKGKHNGFHIKSLKEDKAVATIVNYKQLPPMSDGG